jgi:hypothetical protein
MAVRTQEIALTYQNEIPTPPTTVATQLYKQACSADEVTLNSWMNQWINQFKHNQKTYGPFKDKGLGKQHGIYKLKPCVIVGSGPSLKYTAPKLLNRKDIPVVSCLHNFHYLEDLGVNPEWYVSLDAGDVVVEEVHEGGAKDPEWYWERSKERKLACFVGTSPRLLEKWRGEVHFFNCPVPSTEYCEKTEAIEPFHTYISNGGNVLGACLYIAKGIFGANPIVFMGADFAFGYDNKFHSWNSKYDSNLGNVIKLTDVFGNKVLTWQSYANFKAWFEYVAIQVPGVYINCTEGGTFGSFADGNIAAVRQMTFDRFLDMTFMSDQLIEQCLNPEIKVPKILF